MINVPIKMHWFPDWNGFEIGYPESEIVGLYKTYIANGEEAYMYVDIDTGQILEIWKELEDDRFRELKEGVDNIEKAISSLKLQIKHLEDQSL